MNGTDEQRAAAFNEHLSAMTAHAAKLLDLWITGPTGKATAGRLLIRGAQLGIEVQVDGLAPPAVVLTTIAPDGTRIEVHRVAADAPEVDPASVN